MTQLETLAILEEIQPLVSDKLQVVSYKWLSRNFLVSSNAAKRLLQEFIETHGNGLEVVYTLSGWLKNNTPPSYHIRLVSTSKLEEAKQEFDGNCSVQVYSVQACIPKDSASLWNAEFVQAEELFKQPYMVDNCLRDNRFCGILNSFVKRNIDGTPVSSVSPQPKSVGMPGPSKSSSSHQSITVPQSQKNKVQQSRPKVGLQSSNVAKNVKTESNGSEVHDKSNLAAKLFADREKVPLLPGDKKKGQSDNSSSGNGSSLANLWGRASAKSKPSSAPEDNNNLIPNPIASAEAQICGHEAIEDGSSDDEAQDVNFKRSSNGEGSRKRRVVLDYSDDEYEDAVNLASPDIPKGQGSKPLPSEKPNFNEQTEEKPKVKEEKSTSMSSNQNLGKDSLVASKSINSKTSSSEKIHSHITADDDKKDTVTTTAPNSPKRRKVLKKLIDERGREVTEVVWEGDETETKEADSNTTKTADSNTIKKPENNTVANNINSRAPAAKKSPAVGNTAPSNPGGKAGTKKGGNKDPKQGNILSFFKRV